MVLLDLIARLFGECEYAGKCELYSRNNLSCTDNNGMYYGKGDILKGQRSAGCYRNMKQKIVQQKTLALKKL